jgi:beta-glucosidase
MIMRFPALVGLFVASTAFVLGQASDKPRYLDSTLPVEQRLDDLMPRLTTEEKLGLIHAATQFTNAGIPRLGIPPLHMSDGPHGVREEISPTSWKPAGRTDDFATYMPVSILLAATWNPALAQQYGAVIADEARQRGKEIMLGPGVNLMRTPLNGRNFEYFGEDPWLTSRIAVDYIRGVQAGQVASCVKHFALNNQEIERGSIDVQVDDRTLHELYLPAFEAAVKEAGVLSVMGAYNRYRGQYCCHNEYLLNTVLKGEWGFNGLVMSDWGGVHDTFEAAKYGMDLEMGTRGPFAEYHLARPFQEGLEAGKLPMSLLDDKARRVLRVAFAVGAVEGRAPGSINTVEHQATARKIAEEGIVLLKNDGAVLPLDLTKIKTIAVIGENAVRRQAHGGWSSEIKAFYEITPLEGVTQRVGSKANLVFATGYVSAVHRRTEATDTAGVARTELVAKQEPSAEELIQRAESAAKAADVAVIFAGLNHEPKLDTEGSDRPDMRLPFGQDELIRRVTAANPKTVVVLVSGSPLEMDSWISKVPAVVQGWYAGMEAGHALAAVLFGDVSPSGKLPCTFPKRLADSPAHSFGVEEYPGTGKDGFVRYTEGLLIGYRWFDTKHVEPLFPFGHGLSYTTFEYSNLKIQEGANGAMPTVECDLKNSGTRAGAEVVQVYVAPQKSSVARPEKELRGFAKVELKPGESKRVSVPLSPRAFAYYSTSDRGWIAEAGTYAVQVGSSSRDLRLKADYQLNASVKLP